MVHGRDEDPEKSAQGKRARRRSRERRCAVTDIATGCPFSAALERLNGLCAEDGRGIEPNSRTRALLHGRQTERAVLLLHGLASAPAQFALLGEQLHQRGWNVLIPRLPCHGHDDPMSEELAQLTAQSLRASATRALEISGGLGEKVTVAGFSMGGTLTTWLAQHRAEIDHAVAISPFLGVAMLPRGSSTRLAHVLRRLPNRFIWWDPLLRERQRVTPHGYPRVATHALAAVLALAEETMHQARTAPAAARRITMVVHRREPACNTADALRLAQSWRSNRGGAVRVETLTGLPMLHDILEPGRPQTPVSRVYPRLIEIIDGMRDKEWP